MGSQVRDQYADTRNDGLKHPFVPTTCAIVYVKCVCVCVCVCARVRACGAHGKEGQKCTLRCAPPLRSIRAKGSGFGLRAQGLGLTVD